MEDNPRPGADLALAAVLIIVALVTIYGTLELPAGSFEPLGSARIPQFVAGGIIVFSLWIAARALSRRRATNGDQQRAKPERDFRPRYGLATALMLLTLIYVAVMAMDWVRFSIATLLFLLAAVGTLSRFNRRAIPISLAMAGLFGFGLEYLFTQVFVIDLP